MSVESLEAPLDGLPLCECYGAIARSNLLQSVAGDCASKLEELMPLPILHNAK